LKALSIGIERAPRRALEIPKRTFDRFADLGGNSL
jgi:hypothetical protein